MASGTGFVGLRLVKNIVKKGANKIILLDNVPPLKGACRNLSIDCCISDITDVDNVRNAV